MNKPIEEVVGDNVRRLRKAAGWSQIKLADRADVSQRVISNIEQGGGAGSSSIGILESVSRALGVPNISDDDGWPQYRQNENRPNGEGHAGI